MRGDLFSVTIADIDMEGTITPDEDVSQQMGDSSVEEVTEEMRDKANEERSQGSMAMAEGTVMN